MIQINKTQKFKIICFALLMCLIIADVRKLCPLFRLINKLECLVYNFRFIKGALFLQGVLFKSSIKNCFRILAQKWCGAISSASKPSTLTAEANQFNAS